jgi:HD-like signal output (HDOD) protein
MTAAATASLITHAPRDLSAWVSCFDIEQLPVLEATAETIDTLAAQEDAVDAHSLAEEIAGDPLLTLKLLAHVARLRRQRDRGEPETVTAALVMLGIGPFFRAFRGQPIVTDLLGEQPEAMQGLRRVLRRANRAATFATAFAVHRMDRDTAVIHEAALLHDFAEMLVWLRAPTLALEIARRQQVDPTLRSAQVQRDVLGIDLASLQQALMRAWRLPTLLVRITDHRHADEVQVRNVLLAIRVARHSAGGWDNPALPDDVSDIAALLQLGTEPTWRLLRDIDSGL